MKTIAFLLLENMALFFFLQIKSIATADQTSILYTVIGTLVAGIVAMYFLQRKDQKERERKDREREQKDDAHANTIKNIYDTVVKEANTAINNNSNKTEQLTNAINQLPEKLRSALK